ncbi:hypothetical protein MMC16_000343 [Acarospora aff. strigata]|nr:hypothetical protein [Acarospora aff. strigata]
MLSSYKPRSPHPPSRPSPTSQAQPYQPPAPFYQSKPPPRVSSYDRPYTDPYQSQQPQQAPTGTYATRRPSANSNYNYGNSPPPSNYGFGPRPTDQHNRPPPASRPPATPAPAPVTGGGRIDEDASLFALFKAVDTEGRGQLTERELGSALVNGDFTSFDPYTVRMMIRMFDTDRSGTIGFAEFRNLWTFLASWRTLFDRFDRDHSANISQSEFADALVAFGYTLSPSFVALLFRTYDRRGDGAISFDLFVQSCISLKRMTDVFKRYDDDRDGFITLSFEEFLTEILRQR